MSESRSLHRAIRPAKLLMVAALILCASSCRTNRALPPPPPAPAIRMHAAQLTNTLTPSDRAEIFDIVWRTVNDDYYDSSFHGVNWAEVRERYRPRIEAAPNDQEFYAQFEVMLAELRDAHTGFSPPPPPGTPPDGQTDSLGLSLAEIDGQTVVSEVEPDSSAARAGVRPGMILRTVNGRPVAELYALIRANFAGTSSERAFAVLQRRAILYGNFLSKPRTLGLVGLDGSPFEVTLEQPPAATTAPQVAARRLARGAGYIKFDGWMTPADERFNAELGKLTHTTGLVIDLRANGGGQTDVLLNIAGNFFAAPTYLGGFRRRDGTLDRYMTRPPAAPPYTQPVVILVDERSASASETFAIFMQESRRAYIIGRQSNGALLNTRIRKIKGGGELRVSIRAYVSPQGRTPEGAGVVPDQTVPLTISDLRQGRDAALEAAEAYLAAKAGGAARAQRDARPVRP